MLRRYLVVLFIGVSTAFAQAKVSTSDKVKGAIMGAALGDAFARVTTPYDTLHEMKHMYGNKGISSASKLLDSDWILNEKRTKKAPYAGNTVVSSLVFDALAHARVKKQNKEAMADGIAEGLVKVFGDGHLVWDAHYDERYHTLPNMLKGEELQGRAHTKKNTPWWSQGAEDLADEAALRLETDSGALMRAWPMGVIYSDDERSARYYSDYLTTITHRHPSARAAALALTTGMARALQGDSVDAIVDHMVKAAEKLDRLERLQKRQAKKIWSRRNFKASSVAKDRMLTSDLIRYAAQAARSGVAPEDILGDTNKKQDNDRSYRGYLLGYQADEAVAAAVYLMVRHPKDFEAILSEGTYAVGNASLITSLASALYGARHGYESIVKQGFKKDFKALESKEVLLTLSDKVAESLRHPGAFIKANEADFEESIEAYHHEARRFKIFSLKGLLVFGGVVLGSYLVKEYVMPRVQAWLKG